MAGAGDENTLSDRDPLVERTILGVIGGLAGLAAWYFADIMAKSGIDPYSVLFLSALVLGFASILLVLTGPLTLLRAGLGAMALSVPAALLLLWGASRFGSVDEFVRAVHGIVAYAVLLFVGTPFVAAALQARGGWRDYGRLFDMAWIIVVRLLAGVVFVGLVWAVIALSDTLLRLVGLRILDWITRVDPLPSVISGVALGVALAVAHELRGYVSPHLIHRLLRLLLPVVLLVVLVFLLALPLRGLSGLFGRLSAAAVLIGVAVAAVSLITTALDRDDGEAVENALMKGAARALALCVPVLAGLAVAAMWLRVAAYGWTPDRVIGAVLTGFALAYGLAYGAAVLRGAGWMARMRAANRWLALAALAVAALWLTPLLNAERISAQSQLARFEAGAEPEQLGLWEMAHRWGAPGQAALDRMAEGADPERQALIARAREARSRYAFERGQTQGDEAAGRAELAQLLQVRPAGARLPQGALDRLPAHTLRSWLEGCRTAMPDGRPGCALVLGAFDPTLAGDAQGVLLYRSGADRVTVTRVAITADGLRPAGRMVALTRSDIEQRGVAPRTRVPLAALDEVLSGRFAVVPSGQKALQAGSVTIIPDN